MLSAVATQAAKQVSRTEGVTVYMTLLATLGVLLSRQSGNDVIDIATLVANRTRRETESLVGLLLNTLVFRVDLSGNPTFGQLLHRVREVVLDGYQHQDVPFEYLFDPATRPDVARQLRPPQVLFTYQRLAADAWRLPGVTGASPDLSGDGDDGEGALRVSTFDLIVAVDGTGDGLEAALTYKPEVLEPKAAAQLLASFEQVCASLCGEIETRLSVPETWKEPSHGFSSTQ
jgi:non-ribosomal peptide synthetase component F